MNASAALANKHRELCESIRESLSDSLGKVSSVIEILLRKFSNLQEYGCTAGRICTIG